MDDFRDRIRNDISEMLEYLKEEEIEDISEEYESEEEYEMLLKEIDRDSFYHALNLIDEYDELDEEICEEWLEDIRDLEAHYREYVIKHILNRNEEVSE